MVGERCRLVKDGKARKVEMVDRARWLWREKRKIRGGEERQEGLHV